MSWELDPNVRGSRLFSKMSTFARSRWADFRQEERGSVAIIFGLTAVIIFACVGGAVDYGRWLSARAQTLYAMDAAVLAAGRVLQVNNFNEAAALSVAQTYYNKNKSNLLTTDNVSFDVANGEVIISMSDSTVKTPFLGLVGVKYLPVSNVSKALIEANGNSGSHVEIAMMLDVTGSMRGSKLADMKVAAKDLIDIVVWQDQSEYTSRVALVPFSDRVNVGRDYFEAITGVSPNGSGDSRTCVMERHNNNRYKPRKPNNNNGYFTTNNWCGPSKTIMPLTSDKTALKNHIDSFSANGGTAGHLGTQFAWYALHPGWGSVWGNANKGNPYNWTTQTNDQGNPKLYKIAVLLTDGEYNRQYDDDGDTSWSEPSSADQAQEFCTKMKNKGITVYTVGFAIGNSGSAYNTMSNCATSSNHFYNAANGDQLRLAFRNIALQISTLRLVE